MFFSSCNKDTDKPTVFISLTVASKNAAAENKDTSGALIQATFNPETKKFDVTRSKYFPECRYLEGVATSSDCSRVGVLCRRKEGDSDYNVDALAPLWESGSWWAEWFTQPNCAHQELWLYDWKTRAIDDQASKVVLSRAVRESFGLTNQLIYAEGDGATGKGTYGINFGATVAGKEEPTPYCHVADTSLVVDLDDTANPAQNFRISDKRTDVWACGVGHTAFTSLAYNPSSHTFARVCQTDGNRDGLLNENEMDVAIESKDSTPFWWSDSWTQSTAKGRPHSLQPVADGGFIAALSGTKVRGQSEPPPDGISYWAPWWSKGPVTVIGMARFDAQGVLQNGIRWVVEKPDTYLSYAQLVRLKGNLNLLGYGLMGDKSSAGITEYRDNQWRIPREYFFSLVDDTGAQVVNTSGARILDGASLVKAGWGESDQLVAVADNAVAWAYVPDFVIPKDGSGKPLYGSPPSCKSDEIALYLYVVPGQGGPDAAP
jgi:hypothetical protein